MKVHYIVCSIIYYISLLIKGEMRITTGIKTYINPEIAGRSYAQSLTYCTSIGAELLSLKTPNEQADYATISAQFKWSTSFVWMDLNDIDVDSGRSTTLNWRYSDGTPATADLTAWSNWKSGQPSHTTSQNCVLVGHSDLLWYDYGCSAPQDLLCQIEIPALVPTTTPTLTTKPTTTLARTSTFFKFATTVSALFSMAITSTNIKSTTSTEDILKMIMTSGQYVTVITSPTVPVKPDSRTISTTESWFKANSPTSFKETTLIKLNTPSTTISDTSTPSAKELSTSSESPTVNVEFILTSLSGPRIKTLQATSPSQILQSPEIMTTNSRKISTTQHQTTKPEMTLTQNSNWVSSFSTDSEILKYSSNTHISKKMNPPTTDVQITEALNTTPHVIVVSTDHQNMTPFRSETTEKADQTMTFEKTSQILASQISSVVISQLSTPRYVYIFGITSSSRSFTHSVDISSLKTTSYMKIMSESTPKTSNENQVSTRWDIVSTALDEATIESDATTSIEGTSVFGYTTKVTSTTTVPTITTVSRTTEIFDITSNIVTTTKLRTVYGPTSTLVWTLVDSKSTSAQTTDVHHESSRWETSKIPNLTSISLVRTISGQDLTTEIIPTANKQPTLELTTSMIISSAASTTTSSKEMLQSAFTSFRAPTYGLKYSRDQNQTTNYQKGTTGDTTVAIFSSTPESTIAYISTSQINSHIISLMTALHSSGSEMMKTSTYTSENKEFTIDSWTKAIMHTTTIGVNDRITSRNIQSIRTSPAQETTTLVPTLFVSILLPQMKSNRKIITSAHDISTAGDYTTMKNSYLSTEIEFISTSSMTMTTFPNELKTLSKTSTKPTANLQNQKSTTNTKQIAVPIIVTSALVHPSTKFGPISTTHSTNRRLLTKSYNKEAIELRNQVTFTEPLHDSNTNLETSVTQSSLLSVEETPSTRFERSLVEFEDDFGDIPLNTIETIETETIENLSIQPISRTQILTTTSDWRLPTAAPKPTRSSELPLTETEEIVVKTLQTLGCVYMLWMIGTTFIVFLILRDTSYERFLHMNHEIALFISHVLIVSMRHGTQFETGCKLASLALQVTFLAVFNFMTLEALQTFCIMSNVVSKGGYFSRKQYFVLGWGIPVAISLISFAEFHDEYVSLWSCWLNARHKVAMATIIPIAIMSATAIILAEYSSMERISMTPNNLRNTGQNIAAIGNQIGILLTLPANLASWGFGMWAVYRVDITIYSLVFGCNVTLATLLFIFHALGNPKAHELFQRMWSKVRRKS